MADLDFSKNPHPSPPRRGGEGAKEKIARSKPPASQKKSAKKSPPKKTPAPIFDPGSEIKKLPETPGVYIFRDRADRILYIGKARRLRSRVRSYFLEKNDRWTVAFLRPKIARIETVPAASEAEALLLESALVREHRPPWNVLLKDDKSFLFFAIEKSGDFPRVDLVRERGRPDDFEYFGPFTAGSDPRRLFRTLQKIFRFRSCNLEISETEARRPRRGGGSR